MAYWTLPSPEYYANRAGATVRSQYDRTRGETSRAMSRMGINANSGRFAASRTMLDRDELADESAARERGFATGQEQNANYGLQRDSAIRQWAQLALQRRGQNFSQNMQRKRFDLDRESHGLDMERSRFDLDRARTRAGQQDEAWNWTKEDRAYNTGIRGEDRKWDLEKRGWEREGQEWVRKERKWTEDDQNWQRGQGAYAGEGKPDDSGTEIEGSSLGNGMAEKSGGEATRSPLATGRAEYGNGAESTIDATRDENGNLVLERPDGMFADRPRQAYTDADGVIRMTPPVPSSGRNAGPQRGLPNSDYGDADETAQPNEGTPRRGLPLPNYGGGERGRQAAYQDWRRRNEMDNAERDRQAADKKTARSDDAYQRSELLQQEQIGSIVESQIYDENGDLNGTGATYNAALETIQRENPDMPMATAMLKAAQIAGIRVGSALLAQGAKGKREAKATTGQSSTKGREGYFYGLLRKKGMAQTDLDDERKMGVAMDTLDQYLEESGKTWAELSPEERDSAIEQARSAAEMRDQDTADQEARDREINDPNTTKKRRTELQKQSFDAAQQRFQRDYESIRSAWPKMNRADKDIAVARMVRSGMSPDPEFSGWWNDDKVISETARKRVVKGLLDGSMTPEDVIAEFDPDGEKSQGPVPNLAGWDVQAKQRTKKPWGRLLYPTEEKGQSGPSSGMDEMEIRQGKTPSSRRSPLTPSSWKDPTIRWK